MKNEIVVGIDPHLDTLGCVVMREHEILSGFSIPNCSKEHTDRLISCAENFAKQFSASCVFVIETTNVFWRPVFSYLKRLGKTVFTVNSLQTKNARGTKMRKTKTDIIDAKNIVEVYYQDNAHKTKFPEGILMDLREITRLYSWLVNLQARFLDRIYGYLFQVFPEIFSVFKKESVNSNTVLTLLKQELLHPENLRNTRIDKPTNVISSASHGHFNHETARKLKELAKKSFGIPEGKQGFSICLKTLASLYEHFDNLLKSLELEIIEPMLSTVQHPFSSLKGLGTVQTASFVSELGNPKNFENADDVVAFFAPLFLKRPLGRAGSKCGTKYGRETMYLAAGSCMLHNPVLMAKYKKLRKSRFWKDAKSILAADLTKICYAMHRNNSAFDPNKIH